MVINDSIHIRYLLSENIFLLLPQTFNNGKIINKPVAYSYSSQPRYDIMKYFLFQFRPLQWKGINCIQSAIWQHLSWLKASAFFTLQIFFSCNETQQLILGTGTAIWWLTEPHYGDFYNSLFF
jgi:hypothetical protein